MVSRQQQQAASAATSTLNYYKVFFDLYSFVIFNVSLHVTGLFIYLVEWSHYTFLASRFDPKICSPCMYRSVPNPSIYYFFLL